MYSREYVRSKVLGKKGLRKSKFYLANIIGAILFLIIAAIVAPIAHELAHLVVLEAYGCYYYVNLKLNADSGLYGFIEPACSLSKNREALLYTVGFMSNLVISASLFLFVSLLHARGLLSHSNFFMYVALGFLIDPMFYSFAVEGDAVNALNVIGKPEWMILVPGIGFIMFALSILFMYFYFESFIEDYLRIQDEVSEAEEFIKNIAV